MALDNIQQAVLDAAHKEAQRILEAARAAADEKRAREDTAARQEAERQYQAAARTIDEELARKLIQFRGVAGKKLLERRNERLKEVFAQARQTILAWPHDEYHAWLGHLLRQATEGQGGRIRAHPDDRPTFDALLAELNADRDAQARIEMDDGDPLPARGGFVFVGERYEVDQTLDTLLADLEHEMGPQIAAELFSGDAKETP